MTRGTTPTLQFNLPFETSIIQSAEITVTYTDNVKDVSITKTLEDCELQEKSISATLTQAETLQFPAKSTAHVQLRVLTIDGTALATPVYPVSVERLLADGVIE